MKGEQINNIYIFNPEYTLRNDKKRIIIFNTKPDYLLKKGVSDFLQFIHPLYAILFSLFDGQKTTDRVIEEFSSLTGLAKENIEKLIDPLVENQSILRINYSNRDFFSFQRIL